MADYTPPTENLPIFDKLLFSTGEEYITQNDADKRYLRYPNAQGTENLQTVNVGGTLTASGTTNLSTTNVSGIATFSNDLICNDFIEIKDATTSATGKVIFNMESTGVPLSRLRFVLNPGAAVLNPMTQLDDVLMCHGTSNPNATALTIASRANVACGMRLTRDTIAIGSGGSGTNPNNRINITPSTFQLIGSGTNNNITIDNNIVMSNNNSANRQITTSYLKLTDITSNTPTVQIYGSGTNIAIDNNIIMSNASSGNRNISATFYNYTLQSDNSTIAASFMTNGGVLFCDNNFNGGQFGFTVNDSGGSQKSPLTMSANAFTIASVNPPTSSATIPVNDNTTALATTAWTQSLVATGKTQTVQFTTTTTFNIPAGVIGIAIRMIGKGGIPGTNAAATTPTTSWYSGGTGSGASSISSNGIIGIIGGSSVTLTFDNNVGGGVTFTTNSIVVANVRNGNSGGNATSSAVGAAAATQTLGSSNASFGSFTLISGSGGVAGVGPNLFQSVSGVPAIPAGATNSAPLYQPFIDGVRGCGQRYLFTSGINFFQTSTTAPADGIAYLTYYYI